MIHLLWLNNILKQVWIEKTSVRNMNMQMNKIIIYSEILKFDSYYLKWLLILYDYVWFY